MDSISHSKATYLIDKEEITAASLELADVGVAKHINALGNSPAVKMTRDMCRVAEQVSP
jgi:hypothetical protein